MENILENRIVIVRSEIYKDVEEHGMRNQGVMLGASQTEFDSLNINKKGRTLR